MKESAVARIPYTRIAIIVSKTIKLSWFYLIKLHTTHIDLVLHELVTKLAIDFVDRE